MSGLAVLASLLLVAWQVRELRRATWAQSFLGCVARLQSEELRQVREKVFELADSSKPFAQWMVEEKEVVDLVCHYYDVVGIMDRWHMLPTEIIVDSWCDSLRRLWPICEPRVREHRATRKAPEFWDDFEWLAREAKNYDASRRRRKGQV